MFKNKTYSLVGFLLSLVCLFYIPAVFYTLFLHSFAQPSNDMLMMLYFIDLIGFYRTFENSKRLLTKLKKLQWSSEDKVLTLQDFQYQFNEFCKKSIL